MEQKRMTYEMFTEMLRQKALGVSGRQVSKNLNVSRGMLERWWHKTEEGFLSSRISPKHDLEKYREYIVSILKVYPQIRATNMFFKLKENFAEFDSKRATFYRFF